MSNETDAVQSVNEIIAGKDAEIARLNNNDCWEWQGTRTKNGYGLKGHGNGTKLTHRRVYEVLVGPIPDGLQLDHLCRNRACCNPDHLEPVTNAENAKRGDTGSHKRPDICVHGHDYAEFGVYVFPDGRRACRECRRLDDLKRKEKARQSKATRRPTPPEGETE